MVDFRTFKNRLRKLNVSDEHLSLACLAYQLSQVSGYPVKELSGFSKLPISVRLKVGEAMEEKSS